MQANLVCRWLAIMSISCTHLGRLNVLIGKTASHVKLFQVGCKGNEIKEIELPIEKHKYEFVRRVQIITSNVPLLRLSNAKFWHGYAVNDVEIYLSSAHKKLAVHGNTATEGAKGNSMGLGRSSVMKW